MKFTLGWLKDHLETDASLDAILDGLIQCGFEVEGVLRAHYPRRNGELWDAVTADGLA